MTNYPYGIGLDIGIASVGWSIVALNRDDEPCGIIGMGSRIFDAAENPKTGASLAVPRREKRSMRRRLRRHRHRNERIRKLIVEQGIVSQKQLDTLFDGKLSDIYALRVKALDEKVSSEEFARILIHLSQRRGFKSNRKGEAKDEDGKLLKAVKANSLLMSEKGYRTVAEMFLKDETYKEFKRNKSENYISTVSRDMIDNEVTKIFELQRKFGNQNASEDIECAYKSILLSQRSFDEGPGSNSPYGGEQIAKMWGKCTFEKEEDRAAKATYSFEYFSLLEAVNHMRIIEGGSVLPLTDKQRNILISYALNTANLNYAKLRKKIELSDKQFFKGLNYKANNIEETEKKSFPYMKNYHEIKKAFRSARKNGKDVRLAEELTKDQLTKEQLNAIGQACSLYKTHEKIAEYLKKFDFTDAEIEVAEELNFTKSGHLSIKALDKIIPFLEKGDTYNQACEGAGYNFKGHSNDEKFHLLPAANKELDDITSPVVRRSVSQTIKVINAIIREQESSPTFINIELSREMAKNFNERNEIRKENEENQKKNEKALAEIKEYGGSSGHDLVKYQLWQEQDGRCAYSGAPIEIGRIFEQGYAEVDHIIPYSISFDDTRKNKVLVLSRENQNKGNRVPLQYLTGKRREDFIVWVNSQYSNNKKKLHNLLKEQITQEDKDQFIERNLQDTKTATRFLYNYINDYLEFASYSSEGKKADRKKHVTAINGSITAYMRKRWGINKVRANGDLHHAIDALVIACTTDGMIQKISRYSKYCENLYSPENDTTVLIDTLTGEVIDKFPYPWESFRKELNARLSDNPKEELEKLNLPLYSDNIRSLFVSRMPRRKVTGEAHKETVKSPKLINEGKLIKKTALTDLKLDKDDEIANYYNKESDTLL
ncbi:MAG: type II CRISPR RNA-guided endonuclease Cas9, partial [Clostridia bacterium]|nr:type II CRISPR RNA-guided endonuclease Cas9 [Clostridia bacterium]